MKYIKKYISIFGPFDAIYFNKITRQNTTTNLGFIGVVVFPIITRDLPEPGFKW